MVVAIARGPEAQVRRPLPEDDGVDQADVEVQLRPVDRMGMIDLHGQLVDRTSGGAAIQVEVVQPARRLDRPNLDEDVQPTVELFEPVDKGLPVRSQIDGQRSLTPLRHPVNVEARDAAKPFHQRVNS